MYLLFRFVGLCILAIGIAFAVGDIARSLADETTQFVTIKQALSSMGFPLAETDSQSSTLAVVSLWSMAITCGAIGMIFLLLGHRSRSRQRDIRRIP